ncbi:MAG: GNAT family N-acetyltransferase [Phycisphaeraceae bacterium]|nr:GNAT family N-acetyltransferase [Phycisphaeraceae bacterium]
MASIVIIHAEQPPLLDVARDLFREYAKSIEHLAAASFAQQNLEGELRSLPGKYAPPKGCILLAMDGDQAVGCAALRRLGPMSHDRPGERICEMKRLYAKPETRGRGVGRLLCQALIRFAKSAGYTLMKLDTEPELESACRLYRSLGFVDIPRYNDDPKPETMYLGLRLD